MTTSTVEDFVMLSIEDNGAGMSQSDQKKIFNLYNQLQHQKEGQGIGLYLVKKLIDASGGKIIVESEPGKGTTFKIFFKEDVPSPKAFINN